MAHRKTKGPQPVDARAGVSETGRVNQKQRTRTALVEAASQLVAAGANPTLADVAEHALVSKATAYRYFASAEALVAEAVFDRNFPTAPEVLGSAGEEPIARVLAVERAVNDALLSHESAMRMIVRNAIDRALAEADDTPHRVGRRQALIAAAVGPLEGELEPRALERLRHALALVIGPEAIIAARDVCGLSPDETRTVTRWAAEALVAGARADAARKTARTRRRRPAR
jgi:AcrR family transcriptional regulator